jgi:tetratricopeptide (TPR) repeat protein
MASKVNKKFVVTLVGVLVAIAALAIGAAVFVSLKDGERNVRQGDAFAAQGDWEKASEAYSRAVNKDQTRVDWMDKWRDALRQYTPKNQTVYREEYGKLRNVLLKIATTRRTDVPSYRAFFDFVLKEAQAFGDSRGIWESIAAEADKAIKTFELAKVDPSTGWGSLKRFRGIAGVSIAEQDQAFAGPPFELAKADLQEALKVDPKDLDSALALARWYLVQSERDRSAGRMAESKAAVNEARELMSAQTTLLPDEPRVLIDALRFDAAIAQQELPPEPSVPLMIRARQQALAGFAPRIAQLTEAVNRANASQVPSTVVQQYMSLVQQIDPVKGPELAQTLLDRVVAAQPDKAELAFLAGRAELQRRDLAKAIQQFERVAAMPNKPVSLEGQQLAGLKVAAMIQQASLAVGQVGLATNAEERQAGLTKAKAMRDKLLTETLAAQSPEMLFLEAKIKIAENDVAAGQQLLADYSKKTNDQGSDAIEALLLQGAIAQQRGELGRARESFEKVLARNPAANAARLSLANVHERLSENAEALRHYQDALVLDPDNKDVQAAVRVLGAVVKGDKTQITDPVERLLVEADTLRRTGGPLKSGDVPAALDLIEKGLEANKFDRRLVDWHLSVSLQQDDRARATGMLTKAVAAKPDDERLKQVLEQLEKPLTTADLLAQIEASNLPEGDKAFRKFQVFRRDNKQAEASEIVREAIDKGYANRELFEIAFVQAYEASDLPRAQVVAEKARAANIDQVEGQTFQARLLLMQGKMVEAETILTSLSTRGAPSASVFRLLGNVRALQGKLPEALTAVEEGLRIQPNDLEAQKQQIRLLDALDRSTDALAVARALEERGIRDDEISGLMLNLQTKTGDRAGAMVRREQVFAKNPKDTANAIALAEMYLADTNFAKAKSTIETIKQEAQGANTDPLLLVGLEARLAADQGDLAGARQVFERAIAEEAKAAKPKPDPSLGYARFLADRGLADEAMKVYQAAKPLQDPWAPIVDVAMADLFTRQGKVKDAIEIYKAMVAPGTAVQQTGEIRRRLIELYLRDGQPQQAEAELAAIEASGSQELPLMLMKMRIKQEQGDLAGARAAANAAVAAFPNDAMAYFNRAVLLQSDPQLTRDAILDLDTSIKLRPNYAQSLRARGVLRFQSGDVDGGLQDLKAAANSDPSQIDLRVALITELLNRNRELEAVQAANDGINLRSNDVGLAITLGDLFAGRKLWRQAQDIYGGLWNRVKIPASAERFSTSLLRGEPQRLGQAEQVLASPEAKAAENWGLMILRAELRAKQGNDKAAQADLASAMSLASRTPGLVGPFFDFLRTAFAKPGQLKALLAGVQRVPVGTELWIPAYQARLRFDEAFLVKGSASPDAAIVAEALKSLEAVQNASAKSSPEPAFMAMLLRVRSEMHMAIGQFEESVQAGKQALEASPNDPMLNNNVAYMLSAKLGKHAEALVFAEKASQLAGDRGEIQDTLGTVYLGLNKPEQAASALQRALALTSATADRVSAGAKLVRALVQAGRKPAAQALVKQIRSWRESDAKARERLNDAEFEELVRSSER